MSHGSRPASLPPFVLVTGNPDKRREAERILGFSLDCAAVDLPEIQSLDLETVLRAKGEEAWQRLGQPLIVEETGLSLAALNGFPGPLVKWMLEAVGPEGIAATAHGLGDPNASAQCALLYRDGDDVRIAHGATHGTLITTARGSAGFGWDPIFIPAGQTQTYAELGEREKDTMGHRGRAWRALLDLFTVPTAPGRSNEDRVKSRL